MSRFKLRNTIRRKLRLLRRHKVHSRMELDYLAECSYPKDTKVDYLAECPHPRDIKGEVQNKIAKEYDSKDDVSKAQDQKFETQTTQSSGSPKTTPAGRKSTSSQIPRATSAPI